MRLNTIAIISAASISLCACSTIENWWHGTENEEIGRRSGWEAETRGRYRSESDRERDREEQRERHDAGYGETW